MCSMLPTGIACSAGVVLLFYTLRTRRACGIDYTLARACERSWVQFPQFPYGCPLGTWSSGMILALGCKPFAHHSLLGFGYSILAAGYTIQSMLPRHHAAA